MQDSKASRPTSIGRFGLGFNAVYHFTDLPCFVSGDHLVMFDPHAKYLPVGGWGKRMDALCCDCHER